MIAMWPASLREPSMTNARSSSIAPEFDSPRLTTSTSAMMIVAGCPKPENAQVGRRRCRSARREQGDERDDVVAPAPPDQQREYREQKREQDYLIRDHVASR